MCINPAGCVACLLMFVLSQCLLAQGTFSPGGAGAVCQSCPGEGAGYTTVPYIAATSASSCVCIPGYGMSDTGLCRMCPPNSFSEGISKEDCKVGT